MSLHKFSGVHLYSITIPVTKSLTTSTRDYGKHARGALCSPVKPDPETPEGWTRPAARLL